MRKGVYAVTFGKEQQQNKGIQVTNNGQFSLEEGIPQIDANLRKGDQLEVTTDNNGNVVRITRNGKEIPKDTAKEKVKQIVSEEKAKRQKSIGTDR